MPGISSKDSTVKVDRTEWFRLIPRVFACDGTVEAMSTAEVGCYILLLCKAWHEKPPCTIPTDDRTLSRWTRVAPDEWIGMRDGVLAAFKPLGDGRMIHTYLRQEYDLATSRSKGSRRELPPTPEGGDEPEKPDPQPQVEHLFVEWWKTYPRRINKREAHRAYAKAVKVCTPAVLLDRAEEFAAAMHATGQEHQYIAHPATWLNGERWRDDSLEWWGRDAAKRAKWQAEKAARVWWMTLPPEERTARVEKCMERVRLRDVTDPLRQVWEARYAKGEWIPFAVNEHKQEGNK